MGCNETVVLNLTVMTNVVATPQDHVVPDRDERLNSVVLKDETMFPNL